MKKKILLSIIGFIMLIFCCSCFDSGNSSSDSSKSEQVLPGNFLRLNGFESQKDLNTMMLFDFFGKVELQTDAQYIKSGDKSAKFTLITDKFGGARGSNLPYIHQSTKNVGMGVDYSDFSNVTSVEYDIYNAQAETIKVGFRLVYKRTYNAGDSTSEIKWYEMAPEAWTTIRYDVNLDKIPVTEVSDDNRETTEVPLVVGIDFVFNRPSKSKTDQTFYVDDVRIQKN